MARKQFERQGIRTPSGGLAVGVEFVVYTDEAATALADISATSGGSSIPGSTVTVADIAGLGPASLRFWGPTDDTAVLYLRCPSNPGLGVQEIEAEPEAGGGGGVTDHGDLTGLADDDHSQYATDTDLSDHAGAADPHTGYVLESAHTSAAHDTLGLVTDAILATHEADTTSIHGIADTSALATSSSVTSAVSTHAGLTDPHTGYVLESLLDAKGDIVAASAADTPAKLTAGANDTVLTADSSTGTGLKWATPAAHPNLAAHDSLGLATDAELTTHAGAANPHSVYALDTDLSTHEADTTSIHGIADTSLLALTTMLPFRQKTGLYYGTPGTTVNGIPLGNQGLGVAPFAVSKTVTFDRIACNVTTVGEAGSLIRLGIYNDTGSGYPNALLVETATLAGDSLGDKIATISQQLTPGLYWLAICFQAAATTRPTVVCVSNGQSGFFVGAAAFPLGSYVGYQDTGVSGALPATFNTSVSSATIVGKVVLRAA